MWLMLLCISQKFCFGSRGRLFSSRTETQNDFAEVSQPEEMTMKFREIHVAFYKRSEWLIQENKNISYVFLSRKIGFTIVMEGRSLHQLTQGVFDTRRAQEYTTFFPPELKFWEFLGQNTSLSWRVFHVVSHPSMSPVSNLLEEQLVSIYCQMHQSSGNVLIVCWVNAWAGERECVWNTCFWCYTTFSSGLSLAH